MGGRETGGCSDQVCERIIFEVAKIFNLRMTYSNSIKLLPPKILSAEKITLKVKIPVFQGFVLPSDFSQILTSVFLLYIPSSGEKPICTWVIQPIALSTHLYFKVYFSESYSVTYAIFLCFCKQYFLDSLKCIPFVFTRRKATCTCATQPIAHQCHLNFTEHLSCDSERCEAAAAALAGFVQTSCAHEAGNLAAGFQLIFLHFCVFTFFVQMFVVVFFFFTFLCSPFFVCKCLQLNFSHFSVRLILCANVCR